MFYPCGKIFNLKKMEATVPLSGGAHFDTSLLLCPCIYRAETFSKRAPIGLVTVYKISAFALNWLTSSDHSNFRFSGKMTIFCTFSTSCSLKLMRKHRGLKEAYSVFKEESNERIPSTVTSTSPEIIDKM